MAKKDDKGTAGEDVYRGIAEAPPVTASTSAIATTSTSCRITRA